MFTETFKTICKDTIFFYIKRCFEKKIKIKFSFERLEN